MQIGTAHCDFLIAVFNRILAACIRRGQVTRAAAWQFISCRTVDRLLACFLSLAPHPRRRRLRRCCRSARRRRRLHRRRSLMAFRSRCHDRCSLAAAVKADEAAATPKLLPMAAAAAATRSMEAKLALSTKASKILLMAAALAAAESQTMAAKVTRVAAAAAMAAETRPMAAKMVSTTAAAVVAIEAAAVEILLMAAAAIEAAQRQRASKRLQTNDRRR